MSKWTYHTSHSYKTQEGTIVEIQTQLYKVGIYAIVNGDASMQFNYHPVKMVSLEKILRDQSRKGKITDLVFGREITVTELKTFAMSFDDTILLKIRREFSGKEKYRLFLQQLDRLELELKRERELATKLLKENRELKVLNNELKQKAGVLQAELGEYTNTDPDSKKYVRVKAYNKLQKSHEMWKARFWEQNAELQKLKSIISPQNTSTNEKDPTP